MAGIEFAPPMPGNLQGFNVAPPPNPDPLQTLAQMGQLRTQGLQQQQAALGLQQQQMELDSNRAMMRAFAQGNGDLPTTQKLIDTDPNILPAHKIMIEQHLLQVKTQAATLRKDEQDNYAKDVDIYRGLLQGVNNQDKLDQANANAVKAGVAFTSPQDAPGGPPKVAPLMQFPGDAAHVEAYSNSLALHTQAIEEAKTAAETGQKAAETAAAQRSQAIADIQTATDPATGVPSPADYAAIQRKYPNVILPARPTAANMAEFVRSGVSPKEQPGYDVENLQRELYRTMTANPGAIEQKVREAGIDPQRYPVIYNSTVNAMRIAGTFPAMKAALDNGIAQINKFDPGAMAGTAQQGALTFSTSTPAELDRTRQLRQGDNPALRNVPPEQAQFVVNEALKLDNQYLGEKAKADTFGRFLDLASKGNKATGSMLPIMGAEMLNAVNDIKRINETDIRQYSGMGNLLDRIKSEAKRAIVGQPIPQDLLDDIRVAHQALAGQSWKTYNDSIGSLNDRTQSQFQPRFGPSNLAQIQQPKPGGGAAKIVVMDGRGNKQIFNTEQEAKRFEDLVKQHGGKTTRR